MTLLVSNSNPVHRNDPCPCDSGLKYKKCCRGKPIAQSSTAPKRVTVREPGLAFADLERAMNQMQKLASAKGLDIEDIMSSLLNGPIDDIAEQYDDLEFSSPKDVAQDLLDQAMDAPPGIERKKLAKQALAINPDLPDAWLTLAEESARSEQEFFPFCEKAVAAGERALGPDFFKENEGHFWLLLETRPYMRAKVALAEILWRLKREKEALPHYEDCIRLNTNDNLGIRYFLQTAYLLRKDLDKCEALIARYPQDSAAAHAYNANLGTGTRTQITFCGRTSVQ